MNRTTGIEVTERIFWIGLVLAVGVGFGLRSYGIWENEFWTDELLAIRTSHTIEDIERHCFQRYSSPPLRYLLTWVFLNYPHEARLVRIPSLLAGVLAIGAAALLARNWFGRGAGIWTAWVMALNPWLIAYSQDGRMHGVAMFFYLASIWLASPLPNRRRGTILVLAGVCLALSSAVTYAAVIVCFGGLLAVLAEMVRTSRKTLIPDSLCYAGPWGVWMFAWLGILWWVTSAGAVIEHPPIHPPDTTPTVQIQQEAPPPAPMRSPRKVPLLEPAFYRESLANTWGDGPLKALALMGAVAFFAFRGNGTGLPRPLRLLLFVAPIGIILLLQPDQLYRRYLLSLLPFPLIGIGVLCSTIATRPWRVWVVGALLVALSIPPIHWVLSRPPQAWNSVRDHLIEHMDPTDQLLVGTHQAEFAASYYLVGKIPSWSIIYNGFFKNRYRETPADPGTCWLVQWYGIPPVLEAAVLEYYDKVAEFPGRYGSIVLYREREATEDPPSPSP